MKKFLVLFLALSLLLAFACKKEDMNGTNPEPTCIATDEELTLVDQLNLDYAHQFESADPAVEDEKINDLINYLGETSLVGLGEGTHGTADFYKMKDKIFRQLVTQKNFKAIIFEIPWGNAMVVNDFVTKNIGTVDAAIDQTFYWTYDTQEVRDLTQWIHDYNTNLSNEEHIYFVGCDPQGGDFNKEKAIVQSFLNDVQPDSVASLMGNYSQLPQTDLSAYGAASPEVHQANIAGTKKNYEYFQTNSAELIALSSELEYEIAAMAAHLIQHREYIYRVQDFGIPRDSLMAIYSEWWQRILGEEAKVAIWAHNAHVMDASTFGANWMGTYLRQRNGDDYKNVAFSFGQGAFNAFLAGANGEFLSSVRRQSIPEPECHTTNHLLSLVEGGQHYLIFDELEGEVATYFQTTQPFIQFGAGFNYTYLHNYTLDFKLSKLFDVLIHFDETTESELK